MTNNFISIGRRVDYMFHFTFQNNKLRNYWDLAKQTYRYKAKIASQLVDHLILQLPNPFNIKIIGKLALNIRYKYFFIAEMAWLLQLTQYKTMNINYGKNDQIFLL